MRGRSGKKAISRPEKGLQVQKAGTSSVFGELVCPARLWRLLTLTLAAAKGEQDKGQKESGQTPRRPLAPRPTGVMLFPPES